MRAILRFQFVLFLSLLFTSSVNSQWTKVANPQGLPSAWQAMAIDACDSNTVAFVASFWQNNSLTVKLVKTTDGGNSWQLYPVPGSQAVDISIKDKDHIWFVTDDGKIFSTADGGTHWSIQFEDTAKTKFMNYIKMFDLEKGFAMGDSPAERVDSLGGIVHPGPALILKTSNGGKTWNSINVSSVGGASGDIWRRLDFPNFIIGYFFETGLSPQYLYKTSVGGAKWAKLANFTYYVQVVKFYDDLLGLIVNQENVYRTKDGGYVWENFKLPGKAWGNDIEFIPGDAAKVWITNGSALFFSADTGKTFKTDKLVTPGLTMRDIVFPDKNHGWLYCDIGALYKTENLTKITDVNEDNVAVKEFSLSQNYPNPFNPSTTISYSIAEDGNVKLKIYDVLGTEIATLVNEYKSAGSHNVRFDAAAFPSGMYIYRIEAGNFRDARKLLLLK